MRLSLSIFYMFSLILITALLYFFCEACLCITHFWCWCGCVKFFDAPWQEWLPGLPSHSLAVLSSLYWLGPSLCKGFGTGAQLVSQFFFSFLSYWGPIQETVICADVLKGFLFPCCSPTSFTASLFPLLPPTSHIASSISSTIPPTSHTASSVSSTAPLFPLLVPQISIMILFCLWNFGSYFQNFDALSNWFLYLVRDRHLISFFYPCACSVSP